MNKKLVGHLCLKEPKEFVNHFECAAWWERVLVESGEHPVYEYDGQPGIYYVSISGVIQEDYFPTLWGGVRVGKPYDTKKHAGKHAQARTSFRSYSPPEEFRPLEEKNA